jgi:hypothetical protein
MCILPNLPARNLEELSQRRKNQPHKTEAETIKIIIADPQPLENPV